MTSIQDLRDAFEELAGDGHEQPVELAAAVTGAPATDRVRRRNRRRWAVAVVLAAAVVATVVVSSVVASEVPRPVAVTPAVTVAPPLDAHRAAARAEAERLVALAPRPAGATESPSAPWSALEPQPGGAGINRESAHGWWTWTGTLEDALTAVTSQQSSTLRLTTRFSNHNPLEPTTSVQYVAVPASSAADGWSDASVIVAVATQGDRVGALVEASAGWKPVSTADPLVAQPVAPVDVTATGENLALLHRTLTVDQAAGIVDLVNTMPPGSLDVYCPIARGWPSDDFTVETAAGTFRIVAGGDGCAQMEVWSPNGYETVLQGGGRVHDQLAALLDYPPAFR